MGDIDENDPDAVGELMGLLMDPEVMEASTVLEEFGTEQCGFSSEDSASSDTVAEVSTDEASDLSEATFDSSAVSDFLEANGEAFLNGGSIASVAIQGEGDGYRVSVDATSAEGVDAVSICELLVDFYDTNAPDVDVTVEVTTEGLPAVLRQPGGICES
jgi:hypothetical protein